LAARVLLASAVLLGVLVVSAMLTSNIGPQPVPPVEVARSVWRRIVDLLHGSGAVYRSSWDRVLWDARLPRVALGVIVGGSLSVAGAGLQGLLMNPLADPYLIGVSAGAAVGASFAILLHFDRLAAGLGTSLCAFAAAVLTMVIVYRLALTGRRLRTESFILAGVVVGSFMWGLVTLAMSVAEGDLQSVVSWLLGNLGGETDWKVVGAAFAVSLVGGAVLLALGRELNLIALGEDSARQLGVEVERLKRLVILATALITAVAVSVSGIIGFVGLVIPHIARRIVGPDHRILLPSSALLGASFLIWADAGARVIIPGMEIPVGVVTALLGTPFFLYLLRTRSAE
jgi:iron complex transport system permease protein